MLSVRASVLGNLAGKLVLDFGAGAGRHAFWAATQHASVVAVDLAFNEIVNAPPFFEALLADDPENGKGFAVQASGLQLPFAGNTFDVVIASEVFEHIPDDASAMAEIVRVAKPGGVVCVTVPRFFPEAIYWLLSTEYHNAPGGHLRIYRRSQINNLVQVAGLGVYRTHHAHALHTPYWLIRCLVGVTNEDSRLYRLYHRFLVWDITKKPRTTALLERVLNPIGGKSFVLYARKDSGVRR
ncbi:MAG: class I SAM-dependent methyltransferase [Actinomycetota bacterium]|nr:MAG: class I SAM-dependent methyltransferase [Actinomycetota bacterium]